MNWTWWRRLGISAVLVSGLAVGGCSSGGESGPAISFTSPSEAVRTAAEAYLLGKAKDRLNDAYRRDDEKGIQVAIQDMVRFSSPGMSPTQLAEMLVNQSGDLERELQMSTDDTRPAILKDLDRHYRTVLAVQPNLAKTSTNPRLLNTLGYHFADRGSSQKDFQTAEELLRASVRLWDVALQEMAPNANERPDLVSERAAGSLDSLAWALFKQGRYQEARKYQEEVLRAVTAGPTDGFDRSEIFFHMGEIYAALKDYRKASDQYAAALRSTPNARLKDRIEAAKKKMPDGFAPPDPKPSVAL